MTKILYTTLIILLTSCNYFQTMGITEDDIEKVEVLHDNEKLEMIDGFESKLIEELNDSEYNGITKSMRTHRILVYHKNRAIDTIATNGKVHEHKGMWYISEENLFKKYSKE